MAVFAVRALIRILPAIIDISDEKTTRSATEVQWYTLYTGQEAISLAFSKAMFARERVSMNEWNLSYILYSRGYPNLAECPYRVCHDCITMFAM